MSTCIIVLGVPRSGTSAVAGTLHRLGVDMGNGYLQRPDGNNPRGYYEDVRWQFIFKRLVGDRYTFSEAGEMGPRLTQRCKALIAECSNSKLWGFKTPRTCWTLHRILPLLVEANITSRIVAVHRDFAASVASLKRHSERSYEGTLRLTDEKAAEIIRRWKKAQLRRIDEFDGDVYHISYEDVLSDAAVHIAPLAEWAGVEFNADAVAWLTGDLNHNKEASAVAITKYVESFSEKDNHNHTDVEPGTRESGAKKRTCNCGD